jgi:chaperonin cofactor prefoldin
MSFDVKQVGDALVESIKIHVAHNIKREVEPLLNTQRDLLARVDKQAQQISALRKELAALERKGQP